MNNIPNNINEHYGRLHLLCLLVGSFFTITFFTASGSTDQGFKYPSTPEGVVQRFCQLDAEGKRLRSDTMTDILDLVTWEETGAEVMFVNDSFKVGKATIIGNKASVPVDYRTVGSTDTLEFSGQSPNWVNPYIYKLVRSGGVWKIDAPISAPHVHWKTAIAHLRELQKMEPVRSDQLELIIQKIMKAREKSIKPK